MTPQVDFYILKGRTTLKEKTLFVCQLIEKVFLKGLNIYVFAASETDARLLDGLLWTFKQDSFLPHDLYPDVPHSSAPIRISYAPHALLEEYNEREIGLTINLTNEVLPFFEHCHRIAEIVEDTEEARTAGRNRYRYYRLVACQPLNSHEIAPTMRR